VIDISELMTDPDFVQPVLLKSQVVTTVDYVASEVVTGVDIFAAVQPADMKRLNPEIIDWTRAYKSVYSATLMELGQFVEYRGEDYKIVQLMAWGDNGYHRVVAEQTKLPLLEIT
jgi:hypothetical protein